MAEQEGISPEHLHILAEHAGLNLTRDEVVALKPMYDHYAALIQTLHEVELGMEDLAVSFAPDWDPAS